MLEHQLGELGEGPRRGLRILVPLEFVREESVGLVLHRADEFIGNVGLLLRPIEPGLAVHLDFNVGEAILGGAAEAGDVRPVPLGVTRAGHADEAPHLVRVNLLVVDKLEGRILHRCRCIQKLIEEEYAIYRVVGREPLRARPSSEHFLLSVHDDSQVAVRHVRQPLRLDRIEGRKANVDQLHVRRVRLESRLQPDHVASLVQLLDVDDYVLEADVAHRRLVEASTAAIVLERIGCRATLSVTALAAPLLVALVEFDG